MYTAASQLRSGKPHPRCVPDQVRKQSTVHEGLHWELCCLLAQQLCAGSPAATPRRLRACLLEALQVSLWLLLELTFTHWLKLYISSTSCPHCLAPRQWHVSLVPVSCAHSCCESQLTPASTAQVYPASARLMSLLGAMEARAHTVSRLRRDLRALCEASPSPQAWLMAARMEAQLAGGSYRVRASPRTWRMRTVYRIVDRAGLHPQACLCCRRSQLYSCQYMWLEENVVSGLAMYDLHCPKSSQSWWSHVTMCPSRRSWRGAWRQRRASSAGCSGEPAWALSSPTAALRPPERFSCGAFMLVPGLRCVACKCCIGLSSWHF